MENHLNHPQHMDADPHSKVENKTEHGNPKNTLEELQKKMNSQLIEQPTQEKDEKDEKKAAATDKEKDAPKKDKVAEDELKAVDGKPTGQA